MIDDKLTQSKKRSSLKTSNIFPENMTLEQFLEMNKSKSIKWDSKVVIEEQTVTVQIEEDDSCDKVISPP
jgi:hypothetical protein